MTWIGKQQFQCFKYTCLSLNANAKIKRQLFSHRKKNNKLCIQKHQKGISNNSLVAL